MDHRVHAVGLQVFDDHDVDRRVVVEDVAEDARMTAQVARRDQASHIATSVIIGALGGGVLGTVGDDVTFLDVK